jgi:hypothetical protein
MLLVRHHVLRQLHGQLELAVLSESGCDILEPS